MIAPTGAGVEDQSARKLNRARLRVILYHHLAERPCRFVDQLGITTPPETFATHLQWLSRRYDFVNLDQILTGNLPRKPLLITFDDGYRSVLDVAAPLLKARGAPSVFFVSEAILGDGALPLDNLLCWLVSERGLARVEEAVTSEPARCATLPELFDKCIATMPYAKRMNLPSQLVEMFGIDLLALRRESGLFLRREELARMPAFGIEIGNHTKSHVHCRSLDLGRAHEEIVAHQGTLALLAGQPVRSFSFPYGSGADATDVADRALRQSGHAAIFLVEARLNPRGHAGPYWHRVSMQAQPASQLRRRIEILPWLRSARDRWRKRHAEL